MSKKIIAIGILIIIIIGAAILLWRRGGSSSQPAANQQTAGTEGTISYGGIPQGDTIDIRTSQGVVSAKNFYKDISGVDSGTSAVVLYSDQNYTLWYYRADSSFEAALNRSAGSGDEKTAADKLLKILGVDNSDLCRLKVSVTIPYDRGGALASQPLSFCAKGVQ